MRRLHRQAGRPQRRERRDAPLDARRVGLEAAAHRLVGGGDGEAHARARNAREQRGVAQHERAPRLEHEREGRMRGHHLEAAAREREAPLERHVRVGRRRAEDARAGERAARGGAGQQLRRVRLRRDPARPREAIRVGALHRHLAHVAVAARELAAGVRLERVREAAEIAAGARQDRTRRAREYTGTGHARKILCGAWSPWSWWTRSSATDRAPRSRA